MYPNGSSLYGGQFVNQQPMFYGQDNLQQRLMQMQQMQQPIQQQQFIKCRAVTSQEEASAAMIDLDGTLNVFTDIANGKIYTKQIGMDGMAIFNVYSLSPKVERKQQEDNYQVLWNKICEVEERVNKITMPVNVQPTVTQKKGGAKNE